uniref:Uncharacterized protein n=1 Tax=Branchiostoma floridae TaxID=7739 RepID=C3ZZ56_BRAFL|eukprot:XP_002586156.1 hypothetical protein BRAFLDRAFT_109854 [Branchiostoma floridae]
MCRHTCRCGSGRGRGPAAGGAQVCPGMARERHRLTWAGAARSHTLVGSRDLRSEILAWICRRFGWEVTLPTLLVASGVRVTSYMCTEQSLRNYHHSPELLSASEDPRRSQIRCIRSRIAEFGWIRLVGGRGLVLVCWECALPGGFRWQLCRAERVQ